MKKLLFLLIFISYSQVEAQSFLSWRLNDRYFSIIAGSGQTMYIGELNSTGRRQRDFTHGTLGVEARLWSKIGARFTTGFYHIRAHDRFAQDSSMQKQRNLSFKSNNWEFSLQGIYYFRQYAGNYFERWALDPFVSLGVGMTTFDPYTFMVDPQTDTEERYKLRDYETEGVTYSKVAMTVPVGAGIKMRVTPFLNVNFELAYRYTLTDYLDDVSTSYPFAYPTSPADANGTIRERLSNRKNEVPVYNQELYDQLSQGGARGNSKNKDQYLFFSFQIEAFLPGGKGKMFKKS